jgi:hypothetical protein
MTPWTPRKHDDFFKKIFAALLQITKMSALPQITNNIIFYFFKKKIVCYGAANQPVCNPSEFFELDPLLV